MNLVSKNILWYALPFLVRSLIPLISLPFFTRYLSPDDFGSLALSVIYGVFVVGLLNFGLLSVFERNYFEQKSFHEKTQLMWTCVIFVFINLTFGFVITSQFEESINHYLFGEKLPSFLTILALSHISLKSLLQYFYIYLRNAKNANLYAFISISEAILCVFFSIYFVFNQKGILGYIQGQVLGVTILLIFLLVLALINNEVSFKNELLKDNLKLSLPLTPRIFFGTINTQFDRYMLGILKSSGSVGIYDIGQKIANLGFLFMTILQQVYAPEVLSSFIKNPSNFSIHIGAYLKPFFYLSLSFCLLLGLFSQEIIFLLTTPTYYDAYPIVIILNMLYASYFFGKQPQLLLAKKVKIISFLSFLSVLLNILVNIPLINLYGFIGAAWGTFFSGILTALISFYYSQKYAKISYDRPIYIFYILFQISMLIVLLIWHYEINYSYGVLIKGFVLLTFLGLGYLFNLSLKDLFQVFLKNK
ncbi:oligosaccharide flippase family protein [Flavobacteriaceae bacterium]|nr:oligosaccharide flippase family protein [Flavobacteriaceae bacterium]